MSNRKNTSKSIAELNRYYDEADLQDFQQNLENTYGARLAKKVLTDKVQFICKSKKCDFLFEFDKYGDQKYKFFKSISLHTCKGFFTSEELFNLLSEPIVEPMVSSQKSGSDSNVQKRLIIRTQLKVLKSQNKEQEVIPISAQVGNQFNIEIQIEPTNSQINQNTTQYFISNKTQYMNIYIFKSNNLQNQSIQDQISLYNYIFPLICNISSNTLKVSITQQILCQSSQRLSFLQAITQMDSAIELTIQLIRMFPNQSSGSTHSNTTNLSYINPQRTTDTPPSQHTQKSAVEEDPVQLQLQKSLKQIVDRNADKENGVISFDDNSQSMVLNLKTQKSTQQESFTKDFLELSKTIISFPKPVMFPGFSDSVLFTISFKQGVFPEVDSDSTYLVYVSAVCTNPEFANLEEYPYTVSSEQSEDFKQKIQLRIKKGQQHKVKVAIKVPVVNQHKVLTGNLSVQLESNIPIVVPITGTIDLPQISCTKQLFSVKDQINVINIPVRKSGRIPPLTFRNNSHFSFALQVEMYSNQNVELRAYDIYAQNTVSCLANSPFTVNLQLRSNHSYEGDIPTSDTIRKVLILKVKNSSVYFAYPLEIFVFESDKTLPILS